MSQLSYQQFLKSFPQALAPHLPLDSRLRSHQPFRWIMQFYDYDKRIHYEVGRVKVVSRSEALLEIGLHCESKDKRRNARILSGVWQRMFEVYDVLGEGVSAEPWDRGWAKIYETYPIGSLTEAFQAKTAGRLGEIITCIHPILLELDQ